MKKGFRTRWESAYAILCSSRSILKRLGSARTTAGTAKRTDSYLEMQSIVCCTDKKHRNSASRVNFTMQHQSITALAQLKPAISEIGILRVYAARFP